MDEKLTPHEQKVLSDQFPDCDRIERRDDLILVYPKDSLDQARGIAGKLQKGMDFLRYVTSIDPTRDFHSRLVIGYTKQSSQPNWSGIRGNRIHIPWDKYLNVPNEPLDVCSHELVHPFYNRSPLHDSNEKWGNCFCEFLRGPVKNVIGLNGEIWWLEKLNDKRSGKQNYGNVAGQFLLKAKGEFGNPNETEEDFADRFINDRESIKKFVAYLFEEFSQRRLSSEFVPTSKIGE
jgi:hypothetical protein